MRLALLVAAVVLLVWAALVAAAVITYGTYGVLLGFGLAAGFAAFLLDERTQP